MTLAPAAWPGGWDEDALLRALDLLGVQGVTLYPQDWQHAPALRDAGYRVGGYASSPQDVPAELEWLFVGDEPNISWKESPFGPYRTPAEYVTWARPIVAQARASGYSGPVVSASLAVRGRLFGKYFPAFDHAYAAALVAAGDHLFDGYAVNAFYASPRWAVRQWRRHTDKPVYCFGVGWENDTLDAVLLQRLGGWRRYLASADEMAVLGLWCLGTGRDPKQGDGRWGLVHKGRLTLSGRMLVHSHPKVQNGSE